MNAQSKLWSRRSLVIASSILVGCLLLFGCGAEKIDPAERIQSGADFLFAVAQGNFQAGWEGRNSGYIGGGAEWADETIARVDEARFPDWADNDFDTCVYWERELSYDAMNRDRQPGEPSRYTFEGKAWGWILMKTDGIYVLELGFEFDGQQHVFVDQWAGQP
jgi:hypothetical protein